MFNLCGLDFSCNSESDKVGRKIQESNVTYLEKVNYRAFWNKNWILHFVQNDSQMQAQNAVVSHF